MAKTNVLIVTGPMSPAQLGAADRQWSDPTHVVPLQGAGIRSSQYYQAMRAYAANGLRARLKRDLGEERTLGRVAMCWFSAGHGAARALTEMEGPEVLDQWLALDGLYGPWQTPVPWAVEVARAASRRRTALIATASTSTPGQYGDALTCWKNVAKKIGVPKGGAALAEFPPAEQVYRKGAFVVMGYPEIGHHQQVPTMGAGMLRAFDRGWDGGLNLRWLVATPKGKLVMVLVIAGGAAAVVGATKK